MKTLYSILDDYLEHLAALNYSDVTIRTKRFNVLYFLNFLASAHKIYTANLLQHSCLNSFQNQLSKVRTSKGLPLKPRSINKRIECVKGFLIYLADNHFIQRIILESLKYVKEPKFLPKGILEYKEMKNMLKKINTSTLEGHRDRAIMELMYSSGLRAGEVVNLNKTDIDFNHRLVKVLGKGNKERMVPIGKTALRYLESYLKGVRSFMLKLGENDALFINGSGGRLQYHTLRRLILKHENNMGLSEHITTHSFRRSCATELIRGGANIYHVKEILGHDDLQSLKHYTRLTVNDLRKTHAKCHPREKNNPD